MKNKLSVLLIIVLITFCSGCTEKSEKYFKGSVSEITDSYFAVIPDNTEPIKDIGDVILVPKEVVSTRGVPELSVNDRIQVVYHESEQTDDGIVLDIVYAIYSEDELGEGSSSQAEEKNNSYCIDDWDADIDKDSLYHDYLNKTLAENIKNEDGIRDCIIDVNYENGEIVSADVSIDTENAEVTVSETDILDYISKSLEISTEDIILSFN